MEKLIDADAEFELYYLSDDLKKAYEDNKVEGFINKKNNVFIFRIVTGFFNQELRKVTKIIKS